jgi:RNA polymerase sigma-70 factor (ECF subfamily)
MPDHNRTMIDAAVAGDRAAMDRLLRAASPRMERQLSGYRLHADERADALQNARLQIMRRLSSFREEARLSTWVYRITANEALMILRVRRRTTGRFVGGMVLEDLGSLPSMQDPQEPDAALCAARKSARLHREIERLPSNYRAVLVAHYLDDLDLRAASERLGLSTAAVKARLWRARESMRGALARAEHRAAAATQRAPAWQGVETGSRTAPSNA